MKSVTVYTDGACSGNPGPGGWAAILTYNGHEKELSGGEASTTNNRMELSRRHSRPGRPEGKVLRDTVYRLAVYRAGHQRALAGRLEKNAAGAARTGP